MPEFNLNNQDKKQLLNIARNTLSNLFSPNTISETSLPPTEALLMNCGAFVSLYHNQNLRGCIGRLTSNELLYKTIQEMTRAAALNDHRFKPVSAGEIDQIEIEISVLSPLEQITSPNDITIGKHGIYIKRGILSGTYLPQVALKTNWTTEEFVSNCSKQKAGLGADGWKRAELYRYEVIIINEQE